MAGTTVPVELRLEIEDFLARETELLDERQFTAWLALFADDARYAVRLRPLPSPTTVGDRGSGTGSGRDASLEVQGAARDTTAPLPAGGSGVPPNSLLFEDDKEFLALRVQRLETRLAHAERPPSTTRHLITNVIVEPPAGDEVAVRAGFVVYQARPGLADQLFFGQRQDRLRKVAGEWRITRRLVTLDQNPLPRTLTIFF